MSAIKKRLLTVGVCLLLGSNAAAAQKESGFMAGLKKGEKIPQFQMTDQAGKIRDFKSVCGKNGILLVFFRSADW